LPQINGESPDYKIQRFIRRNLVLAACIEKGPTATVEHLPYPSVVMKNLRNGTVVQQRLVAPG